MFMAIKIDKILGEARESDEGVVDVDWGDIDGNLSNQTDLQTALDGKVPYTGATGNLDLGEFNLEAKVVDAQELSVGEVVSDLTPQVDMGVSLGAPNAKYLSVVTSELAFDSDIGITVDTEANSMNVEAESVSFSGDITANNLSGTNTGDQDLSGYQLTSEKGQANGYASLDAGGKVPVSELPNSIMQYVGVWDASTNSPTLADGAGNDDEDIGDVYRVSVAGTQNLGSGDITFNVGDYVILSYNKIWEKSDTTDSVASVFGRTGIVTAQENDYTLSQIATRDHDLLSGLTDDDHTQYALLDGRSSGQTLTGGVNASGTLTLRSTSNATKGKILFGTSAYDELNNRLGIGNSAPDFPLHITGEARASSLWLNSSAMTDSSFFAVRSKGSYGFARHQLGRPSGGGAGDLFQGVLLNTTHNTETVGIRIGYLGNFNTSPPTLDYAFISNSGDYNNATIKIRGNNLVGINIPSTNYPEHELDVVGNVRVTNAQANFIARATSANRPARFSQFINANSYQSVNLSYNGSSWNLDDTSNPGAVLSLADGSTGINLQLRVATAGTNPRTLTEIFQTKTDGTVAFTGGNVGIGTTSPSNLLTVNGTTRTQSLITGDSTVALSGTVGNLAFVSSVSAPFTSYHDSDGARIGYIQVRKTSTTRIANEVEQDMTFLTNSTERVRITRTGNVGIGTTSPAGKLEIDQSSTTGAIPVLKLDQADVSEEFIEFVATSASDNTNPISTTAVGTYAGKLRVNVNGTYYWIAYYSG